MAGRAGFDGFGVPGGAGHGLCVGVDGEVVSGEAPGDARLGVDGLDGGVVAGGRERVERLARRVGRVGQHQPHEPLSVRGVGASGGVGGVGGGVGGGVDGVGGVVGGCGVLLEQAGSDSGVGRVRCGEFCRGDEPGVGLGADVGLVAVAALRAGLAGVAGLGVHCRYDPVGAENSAVVVDVPRCGPMLSPRVPNLVPIPGITGSARCALRSLEGP